MRTTLLLFCSVAIISMSASRMGNRFNVLLKNIRATIDPDVPEESLFAAVPAG